MTGSITAEREAHTAAPRQPWWGRLVGSELFGLVLTLVVAFGTLPFTNRFLTYGNLANIASNYWPLLIIVLGQMFVLITAGIDLSQTAIMALVNTFGAMMITQAANPLLFEKSPFWGLLLDEGGGVLGSGAGSVVLAWFLMVVLGGLVGLINGYAVARIKMPPFMVTLTTMLFFTAFTIWSTQSENVLNLPDTYRLTSNAWVAAGVGLVMATIAHLVLRRSVYGQWLYSIGINQRAARVSGVPTTTVIMFAYVLSGAFTAVAAALYSSRLGAGRPTLGANLLMDIIGAAVIGGVSLMGGRGRVVSVAFGVLFFVVLTNVLNLMGLPYYTIMWIKGLVIVAAVAIDTLRLRAEGGRV